MYGSWYSLSHTHKHTERERKERKKTWEQMIEEEAVVRVSVS